MWDKVSIQTELQLQEAFSRRALACDLMGACSYSVMEAWHQFLLSRLSLPLRCDRAAWVRLAHSLKRDSAGGLPLDKAVPTLQMDPQIKDRLAPLPGAAFTPNRNKGTGKEKKRFSQDSYAPDRKKGKGKGIPAPLQESGLKHECSKTGARICWNYNLKHRGCKFAKPGEQSSAASPACAVSSCALCLSARPRLEAEKHYVPPPIKLGVWLVVEIRL